MSEDVLMKNIVHTTEAQGTFHVVVCNRVAFNIKKRKKKRNNSKYLLRVILI